MDATGPRPASRPSRSWLREGEPLPGLRIVRARGMTEDFRRHSHRSILVGIVCGGRRQLQTPEGELSVPAGNGFLLPAAMVHRCRIPEAHGYRVACIAPGFWQRLTGASAPSRAQLLPAGSAALRAARRLVALTCRRADLPAVRDCLLDLHAQLAGAESAATRVTLPPMRVLAVREWLEQHPADSVNLALLARIAGCSPSLLSHLFSRHVGLAPYEFLLQVRLGAVARRLRENRQPLADIAAENGFSDQSHLQRMFRRAYGTTPAAYRRACCRR